MAEYPLAGGHALGLPFLRRYQARTFLGLVRAMAVPGAACTVLFPRQAGKNEVAATLVACLLGSNAASGGSVVVCAPTFAPQALISLERTAEALARAARLFPPAGQPRRLGNTLAVGRASAVFLSASPEAHVAGHTASLALVADEAQEVDAAWFDRQFRPMVAATGAPVVLFGTPWDGATLLDRAVARNRARLAAGEDPPRHFEATWEEVADVVPAYGEHVAAERTRLGAGHPLFRTQYGLETVAGAGRLLTAAQLARLEGDHPRERVPRPGQRYVAGLDFGGDGEGADATVLTVARLLPDGGCAVVDHLAFAGAGYGEAVALLAAAVHGWRLERLCADATGLGGPLCERLEAAGAPLERVAFTATAKAALGYALIAAAETGRLRLYADDGSAEAAACRAELAACTAVPVGAGGLRWGAERGHDDFAVSLALCLQAATTAGPPRLARGRHASGW